ncbi:MAG: hypothetical protein JOS17DRAFT_246767 [Linnemannia elongata]|nr:MAG: hypothetical protein JOS17DRAFT_246767 [Linnemannia elongata]
MGRRKNARNDREEGIMKVDDTFGGDAARTAKSFVPSNYFLHEDFFVADARVAEVEDDESVLRGCCCCWARRFEYVLLAFTVLARTPTPLALVPVLVLGPAPESDLAGSRSPCCRPLVSLSSALPPLPPPARQPDSFTILFRFNGRFSPCLAASAAGSLEDLVLVVNTAAAAADVVEDDDDVVTPRERLPGVPTADVGVVAATAAAVVVLLLLLAAANVDDARALRGGRLEALPDYFCFPPTQRQEGAGR